MSEVKHTPGPWEYVPSTEHHGPYVTSDFGTTIADCYVMSNPGNLSVLNGGDSRPIHHLHEMADPNARLIAAAPELLEVCRNYADFIRTSVKAADIEMHPYLPTLEALIDKVEGK